MSSIKNILSLVVTPYLDVKKTFLYVNLEEKIYTKQSYGFLVEVRKICMYVKKHSI